MSATGLTRIETLNKENYDTWKLQMQAVLVKNDAWAYVSGILVRPTHVTGEAVATNAMTQWNINDSKAKSDIILSICPSELKQIKGCETSRDVWLKLESIYQGAEAETPHQEGRQRHERRIQVPLPQVRHRGTQGSEVHEEYQERERYAREGER